MSEAAIAELHAVSRRFGLGDNAVAAVKDASLCVRPGEVVSITGPSGSGKSTLLCLLGALLQPDSGEVEIAGRSIAGCTPVERAELRRRHLGFVFQGFNLLKGLTALENVELALEVARVPAGARGERARRALEAVGLTRCATRRPRELSGGEQQRVAVARALAPQPSLVLADEPTGNLDSVNGQAAVELLCGHARENGAAVVIVTHDPRVSGVADRELWMEDGVLRGGANASAHERSAAV
jgi:putative ABC transport system ATP-binding protein